MTARHKRTIVALGSAVAVATGVWTVGVTLRAQTAWESYKNRKYPASVDKHLTDPALIGAIDLHAHSDPDSNVSGTTSFKLDNQDILDSVLVTLANKSGLSKRGEVFVRKKDQTGP